MNSNISTVAEALKSCWIKETSYQPEKWTATNPSLGQCAVTSLVVHEMFGGVLIRGEMKSGQSHYWNLVGSDVIDLTKDQFKYDLSFERIHQVFPEKLLSDEDTARRVDILKKKLKKELEDSTNTTTKEKKAKPTKTKEIEA